MEMKSSPIKLVSNERQCGDCTHCCDGHLSGMIYGESMGYKKPCKYVIKGKGCKIYDYRPDNPCKSFKCFWKTNLKVPESLKPNTSDVIMMERLINNIPYIIVVEAGKELTVEVLEWLNNSFEQNEIENILYFYNGTPRYISKNEKWIAAIQEQYNFKG